MRFRAQLIDYQSIQLFSEVIATVARSTHSHCVLRLTEHTIYLISTDCEAGQFSIWSKLDQQDFCHEYRCEETDGRPADILISLHLDLLATAFKSAHTAIEVKMKLTNKTLLDDGKNIPCLTIKATFPPSRVLKHEVPCQFVPASRHSHYTEPAVFRFNASVSMPDLKVLKNVVERMKKFSSSLTISANNDGEMTLRVSNNELEIKTYFKNLETHQLTATTTDNTNKESYHTSVDLKEFLIVLHTQFEAHKIICNIVHERALQILVSNANILLQYSIPAIDIH